MNPYKVLFSPIKIGTMTVKNRMVVPAMGTNLAERNAEAGETLIKYYTERARGGFGLIITECTAISIEGKSLINECGMWDDSLIPSYQKMTASVHQFGAKFIMQLRHTGRETDPHYVEGKQILSSSPIPCPTCQSMPKEMSTEEVYAMIETYTQAALRAQKAGFDGIEIHAAHGYLPCQFLSPHVNKRTDEFGGSLHNRMRFLRLIIQNLRKELGTHYPILVRISGSEMVTGGLNIQEVKAICQMLEAEGVDALNISISTYSSQFYCIGSSYLDPGYETHLAAEIRKAVNIPIITVGRFTDPEIAEAVLRDGSADLVAFGRQSICDPHFPNKVLNHAEDEIIPCISCGQGCIMKLFTDEPISCVINPKNGTIEDYIKNKTDSPKHIVVVGGGPGGLQASWILAARGHQVDLFEKTDHLGGTFLAAAYPPGKSNITKAIGFYIRQCKKYGVNITMNKELTSNEISLMKPDTVILATGSCNLLPHIPGLDPDKVLDPCDVLTGKKMTGQNVLICGGGLVGCETANFLAEQRRNVTIIEMKDSCASDLDLFARAMLLKSLKEEEVTMLTNSQIQEFFPDGVSYRSLKESENSVKELRNYDSIVIALGRRNYNPLEEDIRKNVKEVYVIGDAVKAGVVLGATHAAAFIAQKI